MIIAVMYTTAVKIKPEPDCLKEESTSISRLTIQGVFKPKLQKQTTKTRSVHLTLTEESYLYSKRSLRLVDKMLKGNFAVNNGEHLRANNL